MNYFLLNCYVLQWRHNERDGVSNHRHLDGSPNRLFRRKSKTTSKLRVTGLCEGNPPVTGGFPSQKASNAENVYILWCYHVCAIFNTTKHLIDTVVIMWQQTTIILGFVEATKFGQFHEYWWKSCGPLSKSTYQRNATLLLRPLSLPKQGSNNRCI